MMRNTHVMKFNFSGERATDAYSGKHQLDLRGAGTSRIQFLDAVAPVKPWAPCLRAQNVQDKQKIKDEKSLFGHATTQLQKAINPRLMYMNSYSFFHC